MSGTLPSVNKPSIGGRVARAAARGSLKLGTVAFNKMFPTVSKFVTKPKTAAAVEPDSVNTSSEDISRSLFRQRVVFRSILENQQEQNRLLERLLVVYKNRVPVVGAAGPTPGPTPPPAPTPNIEIDIPMPGLPDRPAARPQAQQQRPAPRQRSFLRRYLTFLKRRAPRLYRAAGRRIAVAAAGVAVPGPGWLMTVIAGLGSLMLAAELYKMYREFRASNSEEEDEDIERNLPSEEEAAAAEREIDPADVADPHGILERPTTPPPPAPVATGRLAFVQFDSRTRGGGATQEQRQAILAAAQTMGINPSTVTGGALEGDRVTQINVRGSREPIRVPPPAQMQEPAPAQQARPVGPNREQLLAQIQAARAEAEAEESRQTRTADPLDAALTSAINNAESMAGTANVDAAIQQAQNIAAAASGAAVPLINAIRVEGDTVIYDFDKIKYEAERIKFDGLSIPTQRGVAEPAAAAPSAVSGATNIAAAAGAPSSGFRPMQILTPGLVITSPQPSGAVPLTPGQSAVGGPSAAPVAPVTGTTAQILATIRARESGGNYQAQSRASTASGAYQFINSTWRSVTRKFNIGTEFERAADAPPAIQDAVAAAYVDDILRANNNRVEVVPLVWYTGNAQGRMSDAALAANRGLTAEMYQRNWLNTFAAQGGQVPQTQVAQAPPAGPALAQASTSRVVADREQTMNTQRMVRTFNQQPTAPQQQAAQAPSKAQVAEVPLRSRILEAFNYLAQAS